MLLVEDHPANRAVIRKYLAPHNLQLVEAENGQQALDLLRTIRPDLILMDIQMPVMNGYAAARAIRELEVANIPILALTAYALKEQREQFEHLFDAYLSKPIGKQELMTMLAQFLPYGRPAASNTGSRPAAGQDVRSDALAHLQAYLAQCEPPSQEFLDLLHTELVPRYHEVHELMSVDELLEFARRISDVAESFEIEALRRYGGELLHSVQSYNIVHIKQLLRLFPDIADRMGRKKTRPRIRNP